MRRRPWLHARYILMATNACDVNYWESVFQLIWGHENEASRSNPGGT